MDLYPSPVNGEPMYPAPFALERFFARYEFSARYLLSASDCQGPAMAELVAAAGDELRASWEDLHLGYTESQGLPELRAQIAALYGQVDAERVLVAAPEEAIFLTMHALLAPGRPRDLHLPRLPVALRAGPEHRLRGRPLGAGGDRRRGGAAGRDVGWRFDPAALETLDTPRHQARRLELPPQPDGRPALGRTTSPAWSTSVARAGAWLFSDEMYRLLEPAPECSACRRRPTSTTERCRWPACRSRSDWPGCASAGSRPATGLCWRGCRASRTTPPSAAAPRASCWP